MFDSIAVPFEKVELHSPTRSASKPLLNFTRSCNKYTPSLEMRQELEKPLIDITALRRKKDGIFPIPLVNIFSMIVLVCLIHVCSNMHTLRSLQIL